MAVQVNLQVVTMVLKLVVVVVRAILMLGEIMAELVEMVETR